MKTLGYRINGSISVLTIKQPCSNEGLQHDQPMQGSDDLSTVQCRVILEL
jgi:hypothetical protein